MDNLAAAGVHGSQCGMARRSAGILLWRRDRDAVRILLVHPGGPFWARKDDGAWSIPKGEFAPGEDPLDAARREFTEETSLTAAGDFVPLQPPKQPRGKVVPDWAVKNGARTARVGRKRL